MVGKLSYGGFCEEEVLCVFGQRRRPMSFSVGVGEADYDCVLREAKKVFEDIIPSSSIQVKNEESLQT